MATTSPISLSNGVKAVLRDLWPNQSTGRVAFPRSYDDGMRRQGGDDLAEWYRACVDKYCDKNPEKYGIEGNIALFAFLELKNHKVEYAHMQAVIPMNGGLAKLYKGDNSGQYFRLDFNLLNRGRLLRDLFPHVHSEPKHEPLFPMPPSGDGNVVVPFIEFLYRNYRHDRWQSWTENVFLTRARGQVEKPEKVLSSMLQAFRSGRFDLLTGELKGHLLLWKNLLHQERDKLYPFPADGPLLELLNF